MDVIGKLILQEFWERHKRARKPLEKWCQVADKAQWRNFGQIKQTLWRTSLVKVCNRIKVVVFDIGGNKYRLITTVNYQRQKVIIEIALTHTDYDKGKWKDWLCRLR